MKECPSCRADLTNIVDAAMKRRDEVLKNVKDTLPRGARAGMLDFSFNCPSCKTKVTLDLVLKEESARVMLNWMAEQFRIRARSELGTDFPTELYATGFDGDIDLKNVAKPLHFSVFLVISTEEKPVIEFSMLVRSLKLA